MLDIVYCYASQLAIAIYNIEQVLRTLLTPLNQIPQPIWQPTPAGCFTGLQILEERIFRAWVINAPVIGTCSLCAITAAYLYSGSAHAGELLSSKILPPVKPPPLLDNPTHFI